MLSSSRSKLSTLVLSSALLFGLATAAGAATVTSPANSIKGKPVTGSITIDDAIDPGNLVITLTLDAIKGHVRGFLAQVADESLLAGLSVVGADAKSTDFDANDVGKVKGKSGKDGHACPCDLGIAFSGKSGTTVTFTLTHATQDLTIGLFYGQDFAIKANGIKVAALNHGGHGYSPGIGSSVLEGRIPNPNPIPEPATATLMALGLAGLSFAGRSKQA